MDIIRVSEKPHTSCLIVCEGSLLTKGENIIEQGVMFDSLNNAFRVYYDTQNDLHFAVRLEVGNEN